jgi:hypothetical protein
MEYIEIAGYVKKWFKMLIDFSVSTFVFGNLSGLNLKCGIIEINFV